MALILLLTDAPAGAREALPGLALLPHVVRTAALHPAGLQAEPRADLLLLDGRGPALVQAREVLAAASPRLPAVLLLDDAGLALVSFQWGADGIVHETATPVELAARVRLALETGAAHAPGPSGDGSARTISLGPLEIDTAAWAARLRGRPLDLTFKEFELLRHLAEHPDRVHSRDRLLEEVWGDDYYGGTRTVDVHVRRLRAKLGPEHEGLIQTVRNVGYRAACPTAPRGERRVGGS